MPVKTLVVYLGLFTITFFGFIQNGTAVYAILDLFGSTESFKTLLNPF